MKRYFVLFAMTIIFSNICPMRRAPMRLHMSKIDYVTEIEGNNRWEQLNFCIEKGLVTGLHSNIYRCEFCKKSINNTSSIVRHLQNTHAISIRRTPIIQTDGQEQTNSKENDPVTDDNLGNDNESTSLLEKLAACCICLEPQRKTDDIKILRCFHSYHTKCINKWFVDHDTCPECRQKESDLDKAEEELLKQTKNDNSNKQADIETE